MTAWILAIETVATAGSVALLRADEVMAELALPPETRSARTLAAGIRNVWATAGSPPISLVAVARGPGSFTGLRVGVASAKVLAYAWQAKLLGISTLDAIAAQVPMPEADGSRLQVVLDAQRNEIFVAGFRFLAERWQRETADSIVASETWLSSLAAGTTVSGPALKKLRERMPAGVIAAPEEAWQPRAATVGKLAWEAHRAGAEGELWSLVPQYLRASYAEEKKVHHRGTEGTELSSP